MDKDYWRLKKREQRAKRKLDSSIGQKKELESKIVQVRVEEMSKCPDGVDGKEWRYACERAARAKRYAEKMPAFVRESDLKFQDPMWQWENEVKGRFVSPVGGSLSGTRNQPGGN